MLYRQEFFLAYGDGYGILLTGREPLQAGEDTRLRKIEMRLEDIPDASMLQRRDIQKIYFPQSQ